MPGSLVRDANRPKLIDAETLTADDTNTGVEVNAPGVCRARLSVGTVTGTSPTLDVEIEASDKSDFSSGVVSVGRFERIGDEDNITRWLTVDVQKRYVRSVAKVGGTSPSFGSVTLTLEQKSLHRTATDSA